MANINAPPQLPQLPPPPCAAVAERIRKIGALSGGGDGAAPLYVMTSPLNHDPTVGYFAENGNFGIDVTFFPQGTLPAMFPDGRMILESPTSLAVAPGGNGGVYPVPVRRGIFSGMRGAGSSTCTSSGWTTPS